MSKKILILDTNAFVRSYNLQELSQQYDIYTTDQVLYEIRDKRAKEKFMSIAFEIKASSPEDKYMHFVDNFSKKTGDYATLSETDRELIALAVEMAHNRNKGNLIRKDPPPLTEWIPKSSYKQQNEFFEVKGKPYRPENLETSEDKPEETKQIKTESQEQPETTVKTDTVEQTQQTGATTTAESKTESKTEETVKSEEKVTDSEVKESKEVSGTQDTEEKKPKASEDKKAKQGEEGEDSDGEGAWITPSNVAKHVYKGETQNKTLDELGIAIMTTDFAMQNVIIQMGIPLLSSDGLIIRQTKRWVLECGGCLNICKVMDKQFCPTCGNPTLAKLSVHVNNDGTMTFFRKKNKVFNNRGKIYSIPNAKGGRVNDDLILREDELLMSGKAKQLQQAQKAQEKKMAQAMIDYDNGFGFDAVRKDLKKNSGVKFGYGRMNPNDPGQMKKLHFKK
eukprot:CAMPEP_0176431578 /NCGR_PEP_ID=MMETSP0127-20121128/14888_1 /TAXON_ID=938130 /ORGANISM="Platyophrya macrostoma, Strain WH" /LENGTH=449 /DNA_ID=CAMNT_0017813597 /DNA_START=65 /DNA_END=1414 /DNA_ORIENTATION=+